MLSGQVGTEGVLMSLTVESYFALNATATFIWDLLDEPRTVAEISEAVLHVFRVEPEECLVQTRAFLELLLERQLVQTVA